MFNNVAKTSKYEISEFKNELWLKVFFHNHSTKVNFENESEARHCNSEYKYSILDEINANMRINNRYEFILDFPYDNVYIQWSQLRNPVKEFDGKSQADGFTLLDDNVSESIDGFHGLTRSTIRNSQGIINCFLDGVPSDYQWYYAIGMYEYSESNYKYNGIPTYKAYSDAIRLWIKINPRGNNHMCTFNNNKYIMNKSLLFMSILISRVV